MNILIVGSQHAYSSSANGICMQNMADEFLRQGHEVYVIASGEEDVLTPRNIYGANVWTIKQEWIYATYYYLQNHNKWYHKIVLCLCSLIRLLYSFFFTPNGQPIRAIRVRRLASRIIEEHQIELVLCTCLPYASVAAGIKLKEKHGDSIQVVSYHLDLLSFANNGKGLIKQYKEWRSRKAIQKELKIVDKILVPESGRGLFEHPKIRIVGFPVFLPNLSAEPSPISFDKKYTNISFIGSLDKANRSPLITLRLFTNCIEKFNIPLRLHFWGNVADSETMSAIEECPFVEYHGMLDHRFVEDVYIKSDFLLNISNKQLYRLIPSKIFQMIASNKPIINIVNHQDDVTLQFFQELENTLNIFSYESPDIDALGYFLTTKRPTCQRQISLDKYTPAYICQRILA